MFKTLTTISIVGAAAYFAAKRLLEDDTTIGRLPAPARGPANAARSRLVRARDRAKLALAEGRDEKRTAEAELMAEYHRKAGRRP